MDVRITILVENTTTVPGLLGEYGFSALIEVDGQRLLFDTGNGEAIISNARQLGIDLSTIEALVISHGHFDHTGGVMQLLPELKKPIVYAHPEVFARHQVPAAHRRRGILALLLPRMICFRQELSLLLLITLL